MTNRCVRCQIRRCLFGLLVVLAAFIPTLALAQEELEQASGFLIRGGSDVSVNDGEAIGVVVVYNGNVTIDGAVQDLLVVVQGDVVVNGAVGNDIYVVNGSLTLGDGADVAGDIALTGSTFTRSPGAEVAGSIDDDPLELSSGLRARSSFARIWSSLTIFCLVIALVLARTSSNQIEQVGENLTRRPLTTIGTGFIAVIAVPLVGLLALSSFYTLPLGTLVLVLTPLLWIFGYIFTGLVIGRIALRRTGSLLQQEAYNPYAAAVVGVLLLQLGILIPLADLMIFFFAAVVGMGSIIVSALSKPVPPAAPDVTMIRTAMSEPDAPRTHGRRRRAVARVLVIWMVNTITLLMIAGFTPLITFDSATAAILFAAVVGIFNALIRPIILRITLPLTVLTMGLFVLYVDAVLLQLAETVLPGMDVQGFLAAILTAFILTITHLIFGGLLAINDDDSFYRYTLRRVAERSRDSSDGAEPSLIIIEIDGLSEPVLLDAIDGGYTPTLKRWIETGSHSLVEFDCGLPAQTSACQAGILYGDNFDIPAFRWFEKDSGTLMVSNNPRQAVELDARLSSRNDGLLHPNGVSIGNLVTGGALEAPLTMGAIQTRPREFAREQSALYFYFLGPYNLTRTILLMFWEIVIERWESLQQRRRDVQPRIHRSWTFVLERVISTVFLRDLETAIVLRDIYAGIPISYAMYVGYDVVAHHAGPSSPDALKVLQKIDNRIGMLERAALDAPGEVELVVLSDHGQSSGATFLQRFGESLEQVVTRLIGESAVVDALRGGESEGFNQFNAMLSGLIAGDNVQGQAARAVLRSRTEDGYVDIGPESRHGGQPSEGSSILVLASGNLGLVYLKNLKGRANLDDIETIHPGLITGLVNHEGIGFIMVRTKDRGAAIIGKRGTYMLDEDRLEGEEDPLAPYGPRAAAHFRRLDSFPNVADIMVNSAIDLESDEVPAFEELVGSHGGIGGEQTRPFLLHPTKWEPAITDIETANEVYLVLAKWRDEMHRPVVKEA